jgi:hypothetical protein
MIATIEIYRVDDTHPRWDADTNELDNDGLELLWSGMARVQDNKDWRARTAEAANDPQMIQYVRVQIPLDQHLQDGTVNRVPHLDVGDLVRVVEPDPESSWALDPDLSNWVLRIRNTMNSSNPWLRNLLCGVDMTEPPWDDAEES